MNHVNSKFVFILLFCLLGNTLRADIIIPFELVNGLIIIEAEVDGVPGNYIVDSGSNGVLLNGNSVNSTVSYQTLNSTLEGSEKMIRSFRVGDFEATGLLGFSTDLSNLEVYINKSLAGILGCSVFRPNSLIFDFKAEKIIISDDGIEKSDVLGLSNFSFQVVENLPLAQLSIGGENVTFILDSGASSHFFDSDLLYKSDTQFIATGVSKSIFTATGVEDTSLEYILPNCKIGDSTISINAYEKDFDLISQTLNRKISGLLSLSKLTSNKVYFDLNAKIFYFD